MNSGKEWMNTVRSLTGGYREPNRSEKYSSSDKLATLEGINSRLDDTEKWMSEVKE